MENRLPRMKKVGKSPVIAGSAVSQTSETKMARDPVTPEENDPLWEELGSTRIVDGKSDSSSSSLEVGGPANYTEFSPSVILGKNLKVLGDFQLKQKLGEGAMGAVYKAKQISFNRTVALKVLFPHVANNKKLVDRLIREGQVMGRLDHPNIIQAYAVGEAAGCHYVAMEYVSGLSTQKWLTQLGRLPVADAVQIILVCAKALAYAHSLQMVHRDIKPDNILLTRDGTVKVADLGMVKIDDEMALTQTGHAVGTPWFMPLEQARNAKDIDGRSDIYALGCTLYAFLTGRPPFRGQTIVEVIQAKDIGTFPPARQTSRDVPERLDLIIAKMTAKLPKYRYQTCEELIKDLESLNLASAALSFLQEKPAPDKGQEDQAAAKMNSTVASTLTKSSGSSDSSDAVAPDPNLWYVQVKSEGKTTPRKYTTTQLQNMLTDGKIRSTAQISHSAKEGFRALATYKEFQGAVLSKVAKKVADKKSARIQGVFEQIKEQERQREEKERADSKDDDGVNVNTQYWLGMFLKVLPLGLGVVSFIGIFLSLAKEWSVAATAGFGIVFLLCLITSIVTLWKGN